MPRPEDRGRPPGLEGKGRVRPSTATAIAANSNRYGGAPVIGQTTANPVFSENTAEEITKPGPSAGLFPFFGRALGCFGKHVHVVSTRVDYLLGYLRNHDRRHD
jgi:hypothetical protein